MPKIRETNALLKDALENHANALESIGSNVEEDYKVPSGYISMELSTNGLLGAPKRFHTRNFDTSDILNLALSEDEELPEKVAKMLDNLIYEDDVSVMNFHEKEVIEYLARLYQAFFANILKDIEFPWNEEDLKYLQNLLGKNSTEYEGRVADLKTRRWIPKVSIDLSAVDTYDLDEKTFKTKINLTTKDGFKVGFSYPRYGDVVTLRNFILQVFREQDKQFASIKDMLRFRRDAEDRVRQGEEIALSRLPNVPEAEKEKFRNYEVEKSIFSANAIKALHLVTFDGQDVSQKTLKERIELANDPRIDYNMMRRVNTFYEGMKIGLKEKVSMLNPITGVVELRDYSFRLIDLLQAARMASDTQLDVEFE